MSISKNIIYNNEDIKFSENYNFHIEQLEIASLNIEDFNKRLNLDIKLSYSPKFSYFLAVDYSVYYERLFSNYITSLLSYQKGFQNISEEDFIRIDLQNLNNIMQGFKISIISNKEQVKNSDEILFELKLFLKRYTDYCPLGILSQQGQEYYKNELNKIVEQLYKVMYMLD